MPATTVVTIRSLSYTGTTWINLLVAAHADAFALGPCHRILGLLERGPEAAGEACRLHNEDCTFWPGVFRDWQPTDNLFRAVAAASGRRMIVINNPTAEIEAHLDHPEVDVREIVVVRDGRGTMNSYRRYYPDADYADTVHDWFWPAAIGLPFDPDDPDRVCLRYEDVVRDPMAALHRIGDFIGCTYDERSLRYWEFDQHHPVAGNGGPLALLRLAQGIDELRHVAPDVAERYQRLTADPRSTTLDERWRQELGHRERLVFDAVAGAVNERWGYERDRFTVSELAELDRELTAAGRPGLLAAARSTEAAQIEVAKADVPSFKRSFVRRALGKARRTLLGAG